MNIDLQYKIASNPRYQSFLRENSHWYKYLNRDSSYLKDFDLDMKDKYVLKPTDRLNKMLDNINTLQMFIDVLK